jgi:hypothetical protein
MNANKERTPVTARTPTSEGTPTSVVTPGAEGMFTTAGPQQQ